MTRRGTYATLGAAVLVMAALLVAALAPPVQVLSRPRSTATSPYRPTLSPSQPATPTPTTSAVTVPPDQGFLDLTLIYAVFVQALLALLALGALFGLALLVQAAVRRRPRLVAPEGAAFAVPPVPPELLRSSADRMALLESGEPRNAIVAAWLDLETQAAATGLPREPAETSTEYTTRVIGTWRVDPARLADLAQLYREARFSLHALGEDERRRAVEDLGVLHGDLERAASQDRARDDHAPEVHEREVHEREVHEREVHEREGEPT